MKGNSEKINDRILIGSFWIYLGAIFIIPKIFDVIKDVYFIKSFDFFLTLIISLFSFTAGILILLNKRFAFIGVFILALCFITGTWGLGIHMIIYGISDILKFQTPGSYIQFAFGIIVCFSSIPFIFILANLNQLSLLRSQWPRSRYRSRVGENL